MADEFEKPKTDTTLPSVEAPSISPAEGTGEAAAEPTDPALPALSDAHAAAPAETARGSSWATWVTAQPAVLAASIVLAAALGGIFGALAIGAKPKDVAGQHEWQAMQQSLARLTKDLVVLKSELTSTARIAKAQTARVTELDKRLQDKLARDETIVTGSITPAVTTPTPAAPVSTPASGVATMPAPQPAVAHAPLPPARPAARNTAARVGIAAGWTVLGMHRGFVYVQRGREVYRVAPGARLPGLGVVEDIRQERGEWVVFTRHGVIVASRDGF